MEVFILERNIANFRERLKEAASEAEREQIRGLLHEHEARLAELLAARQPGGSPAAPPRNRQAPRP